MDYCDNDKLIRNELTLTQATMYPTNLQVR